MSSFLSRFIKKFKNTAECPQKEKCLEILNLVMDGEATDEQCDFIHTHIKECVPCNEIYEVENAIKAQLQQNCTGQAPDDLVASIKTKINQTTF